MLTKSSRRVAAACVAAALAALCAALFAGTGARARTPPAPPKAPAPVVLNLRDFGALGNGSFDDGPALQRALDALAEAGGGTLTVPEGRYAIGTPVSKDFTGLASAVSIEGVPVDSPVSTVGGGYELSTSLGLLSQFYPRTRDVGVALTLKGLQSLTLKDLDFVGTFGVKDDAIVTLSIVEVEKALVRHCEFYGLVSLYNGATIRAMRSNLHIEHSKFLGTVTNSANAASVVQNLEWKGVYVSDTIFLDYGRRAELQSKTGYAAPYSWVGVGNAAALTGDSPRREVVVRTVALDEGALFGLSSTPFSYPTPPTAPIDLFYVTGLRMNVSNLNTYGHRFDGLRNVLVESSRYGWSHRTQGAIQVLRVGNAILDRIRTEASATRLAASTGTGRLTVINSVYQQLDSQAQETRVINTTEDSDDPVWYVRQQFQTVLNRAPDPAGHLYWSDQILRCGENNAACVEERRAALNAYLATAPPPTFNLTGRVTDGAGEGVPGAAVALTGSQTVKTFTDASGNYRFLNLPTSGVYTVSAAHSQFASLTPAQTFTTPNGDRTADFTGAPNRYTVAGRLRDGAGNPLADTAVRLVGTQTAATTTDSAGNYSFTNLTGGGNLTVVPSRFGYAFTPVARVYNNLAANQTANFTGAPAAYTIGGRVTANGVGRAGVALTLSGAVDAATTTSADGSYSFAGLPAAGNYVLTASSDAATITPPRRTFSNLAANQTADFKAIPFVNHARASNGAKAAASSYLDVGRAPLAAVNGDRRGLRWAVSPSTGSVWTDATQHSFPDWLEVRFPGPRSVQEVSVFSLQDNFTAPAVPTETMLATKYALTDFDIEYWDDGAGSWAPVPGGHVTGNDKVWRKLTFEPLVTTKLRVVAGGGLGGYSRVVEFEAWGPPIPPVPGPRINHAAAANGADAVASSTADRARHPQAAINSDSRGLDWGGDPMTGGGWVDATPNKYPDWLQVTFNGPKKVTEVWVFGRQDSSGPPVGPTAGLVAHEFALVDFSVQYWDGSAWVDLPNGVITGNDKVWRRITFPAVTTDKLRVVVTKALADYTRIAEVMVF
ncbi:MAG TPA: carboxypeptidase regulatory-like domain-containing protein [Pyrinomonadaceae bacterium]|nr:carboxypeptidase regulatory-like domain-containing protein [Pyrinomonadaceae bacterium]